jgi:hypothetical protein
MALFFSGFALRLHLLVAIDRVVLACVKKVTVHRGEQTYLVGRQQRSGTLGPQSWLSLFLAR